jgi:sec-independent protein translocase protein TatA
MTNHPVLFANIFGPELLIVVGVVVFLFGGSQIPKLARSLGQASKEFKSGQIEQDAQSGADKSGQPQSGGNPGNGGVHERGDSGGDNLPRSGNN